MKAWLRNKLPDEASIKKSRLLGWAAPWLGHPRLWHLNRRGVALGLAIGVFFGFLIPIAQIPVAAIVSIWMRANVPAAAFSTLVTNPLTFGPVYALAYFVGDAILEGDVAAASAPAAEAEAKGGVINFISEAAKPLFLGLSLFAVGGSLLAYGATMLCWRLAVVAQAKRRRARRVH
jgi:uncharacterized protein